ncbi:OLC1v1013086C1 [Oldenlandia corymbosa var. corymbosa]|uniref:OLC1v1013086C1 n=1 Tax=Oldenlandia corymbosa var. corymbosa TaxID=529605 RepID=A0AAV1DXS8_OLDCO|nr:OLC1v1013086C1 [Oldenlandia corymbosa var. corymbosa]
MSRFPSNIDAHLRPQQHLLQRSQSTNSNSNPNPNPNPNPNLHMISTNHQGQNAVFSVSTTTTATSAISANANNSNNVNITSPPPSNPQQQQQQKANLNRANPAELQMAYQDAWRVCHPDFKRPFTSLEDACERLLPYHVVADYEAEEDDKILDSDSTGQMLSRSQQWDHNIAAKVAEFAATFEKQVLAFNIISRKRDLGEFRTEEKLMIEQLLLQEERRALLEMRAEMDSRQKTASRESQESNLRMAAMAQEQSARGVDMHHAEMLIRAPMRASALGSQMNNLPVGHDASQQDQVPTTEDMMNGWGNNGPKDEKEPSDDFLNDEETENGDGAMQSEWRDGGDLDLNAR